jgi:predicted nucleotidyltransferase
MRLSWNERYALAQLNLPKEALAFVFGSRLDVLQRGGDIDLLVRWQGSVQERFELAVSLSLQFQKLCQTKIDVLVVPLHEIENETQTFLNTLSFVSLDVVLSALRFDHLAVLVKDLALARRSCLKFGFEIQPTECFAGEGTKEFYVGESGRAHRLLLVEAIAEGPYLRAMHKRGSGIHHLGLSTTDLNVAFDSLSRDGWQILTKTGEHTHWYFKKGLPLLEVYLKKHEVCHPLQPVVEKVLAPFSLADLSSVFEDSEQFAMVINGKRIDMHEFLS